MRISLINTKNFYNTEKLQKGDISLQLFLYFCYKKFYIINLCYVYDEQSSSVSQFFFFFNITFTSKCSATLYRKKGDNKRKILSFTYFPSGNDGVTRNREGGS